MKIQDGGRRCQDKQMAPNFIDKVNQYNFGTKIFPKMYRPLVLERTLPSID